VHIEAFLAIGGFALVFGGALFLLAQFFAKRWVRKNPTDPRARLVDAKTLRATVIFVCVCVIGIASTIYAPGSTFARLFDTGIGLVLWVFLSSFIGWGIVSLFPRSDQNGPPEKTGDV